MTASDEVVGNLKQQLRPVVIDDVTYYVAEGDLLLTEARLAAYADGGQANTPRPPRRKRDELVGVLRGGRIVRWKPGLELTYTIRKSSFTEANYKTVRGAMQRATQAWEATCGVSFVHRVELDDGDGDGALFRVRQVDTGGRLIAAAFFPDEPAARRQLIIDPSFYTTSFDQDGVLRHELGHVLGFRHEHIRPEASALCPKEDLANTINLSLEYDPKSVMHYFCGGVGSKELAISETDVIAAQRVYGPPLAEVEDIAG